MRLENKVAIVTGAGRNIGEDIANTFAAEGAKVAVVDLDKGRGERVTGGINAAHPDHALQVVCDVSSAASVEGMVKTVVQKWGGVDILVNNAAWTDRKTILDLTEEEWDKVMNISLKSVFLCTKFAARVMVDQKRRGRIVNISSTSGHTGRKDATAYTAAKAAILNLTRSLAVQLSPYGIRVNSVTPNRIGSPVGEDLVPENRYVSNLVGRRGVPQDIANAVLFLASDEADFITAADLLVDGGAMASRI
ncbi:MAG: short-chain dehydrogenase [Deltaproteobacteria bacterium RIFCSPHIGHO2_02_FULL_60_17]|nr:MAG: short-chain dehydrogenase [Deltaproteobacteria bacterium RIFCSPHIGHO2_02_FULL_60_17]OGQ75711.1 MAG: short-chain dehydrogenase [Deltaproteobacteria bacterium RIFCSPLOWO2_12_FULL_60_16]